MYFRILLYAFITPCRESLATGQYFVYRILPNIEERVIYSKVDSDLNQGRWVSFLGVLYNDADIS